MKSTIPRYGLFVGLALLTAAPWGTPHSLRAQVPPWGAPPPMLVPVTPQSQRAGMTSVQSRVKWLQNATRTARN